MARIRADLFGSVIVTLPDRTEPIVLLAGDVVPEGVVVGDHVLASASEPAETKTSDLQAPAKAGPGSGKQAWRAYALQAAKKRELEIEIPEDATREDIITALEEAQIPTE